MAQTSAMGRWCGPAQLPAEVAHVMLVVTLAAQWGLLIVTPLLGGTSVGCLTVVAEAACDQATVGTGASEHLWVTPREHFHVRTVGVHGASRLGSEDVG